MKIKMKIKIKNRGGHSSRFCIFIFIFIFIPNLFSQSRIESEFKLAVPEGQEEALWQFLQTNFSTEILRKQNPELSCTSETEFFLDQYFDDEKENLLAQNVGVRFRQRFLGDSLIKTLVQLKLPGEDSTGVARQEVKFSIYKKTKRGDRLAMHPFWRHIKPKDRDDVRRFLSPLGIRADELRPALKLEQLRRRVYISEEGQAMVTITLDRVSSAYFPYPSFTEMEIELNEVRYTGAGPAERERLEKFNAEVKQKIMAAFPGLKQDQSPKYNKMYDLVGGNWLAKIAANLSFIVLGGIVFGALFLFLKTEVLRV